MPARSKKKLNTQEIHEIMDAMVIRSNQPGFIENDPICIPHMFSRKQGIEIAGFFAAILAWGQRVTIIRKGRELMRMMDDAPYDFMVNHTSMDLTRLLSFKHRTFNTTDTLYLTAFLQWFYQHHESLEEAFIPDPNGATIEKALRHFHDYFFSLPDAPARTRKHIPTPERKSTCKRLNMFLRWMVRRDQQGVDFGIWTKLKPSQLVCPCDVHVDRVARSLRLIKRKQTDWLTAVELTEKLKQFDPQDPVKYDFALFGMGVDKVLI